MLTTKKDNLTVKVYTVIIERLRRSFLRNNGSFCFNRHNKHPQILRSAVPEF